MGNVIERLFDSVTSRLQPATRLDWPIESDVPDLDPVWMDINSSDDQIYTLDESGFPDRDPGFASARLPTGSEDGVSDDDLLAGGIRYRGMEVLAFYKSRRYADRPPYSGRWGIFYFRPGLFFVASEIHKIYPGYNNPRLLALEFLRAHERFHFQADVQTLLFESVVGRQLYEPIRMALRRCASQFVEEALANRQAWEWAKRREVGLEEFAYDFMKLQPNAYSRFDENRLSIAAEWASVVVDQFPPGRARRDDLAHWVESIPKAFTRPSLCPEYIVDPANLGNWISPSLRLPPVRSIREAVEVIKTLSGRFAQLRPQWERTKEKLLQDRLGGGLNMKPWPKDGKNCCSVRVDDNFRAHLRHEGVGVWEAYAIGPHTSMGHG